MKRIRTENESGVFNARWGKFGNLVCLFTHRDPKSGELFIEEIKDISSPSLMEILLKLNGGTNNGWVRPERITFI